MTLRHLLLIACTAGALELLSGGALAHSNNETTTPADGAVLDAAPDVIAMTFDKPMRLTMIRLVGGDGDEFEVTRRNGMAPVTEFEASPAALEPGAYTVEWQGLSSDGHPMEGVWSRDEMVGMTGEAVRL